MSLHAFAKNGDVDALRALLDAGVPPDLRDERRYTPLMYACDKGRLPVVAALLERGACVDAQEEFGESRLPAPCRAVLRAQGAG
jgi:ankyrin repeat protein